MAALAVTQPARAAASVGAASGWGYWLVSIIAAAWLAAALAGVLFALRAQAEQRQVRSWARRVYALLGAAPQAYALVSAEGSVQTSDRLRNWLGLPAALTRLADIGPALDAPDAQMFTQAMAELQARRVPFDLAVNTRSSRALLLQGRPLDSASPVSIVWVSDVRAPLAIGSDQLAERTELLADLNAATAILEAAPFPIWHRDTQLQLRHVNSAYVRAVGGNSAAETVASARDIAPPALAEAALRTGSAQSSPASMVVDGSRRSLQVFEVPIGDDGIGGFALDVTDREEQAQALVRFSEAQRDTLDMLSAPVVIFGSDQKLMFHNVAFSALFRLAPEWLAEKPRHGDILERLREHRRVPEQSDFAKWKQAILGHYTSLLKPQEDHWHLPNETTLRVVTQPHPQGGLQLLFEDVTPRLVLERSYNTLFQVQQATLNNLHEGAAVFRADGTLSLTNSALERLWHCASGSFVPGVRVVKWLEVITPHLRDARDAKALEQAILTVIVERRSTSGTLACREDASLAYVGVPLPDGSALITFLDVSDSIRIQRALKDRNDALESSDQLKTAFLQNMSYQLRTPLQNIMGFTEMLDHGYLGELQVKQAAYLKDILAETRKLDELIRDVLELTVSDVSPAPLQLVDVSVERLLTEQIGILRSASARKKLQLVTAVAPDIGQVRGDPERLNTALGKIISNALEFTPRGGTITIAGTGSRDSVSIVITDTGSGISEADKSTIFESFRKGDNAKGTKALGLGLALSRHVVTLHGGTITLESQVGIGTAVTIVLPRTGPASDAANG